MLEGAIVSETTRASLLDEYDVSDDGDGCVRVTSPGRFEGEPLYVPFFWEVGVMTGSSDLECDGCNCGQDYCDCETDCVDVVDIDDADRAMWPELGDAVAIALYQSDVGFVGHSLRYAVLE